MTTVTYKSASSYLFPAIMGRKELAKMAEVKLLPHVRNGEFDTFVGRGLSGTLVVPMLAEMFDMNFAIVRKPESSHASYVVEGIIGEQWLFVDDFISSGDTFRAVSDEVATCCRNSTTLAGAYLYYLNKYLTTEDLAVYA